MKKVSILIPCFNEEEVLPLLISSLKEFLNPKYEWEMVFVDDGSLDNTLPLLLKYRTIDNRICVVELSRNFGKEAAMQAGLEYVHGDCVIIMDADLQHPTQIIPMLIDKWEQGYDDVYARRVVRGKENFVRRWMTRCYYSLLQSSTSENIYPNVGDFRLLDRCCIEALKNMHETNRYTKGLYGYIGFRKTSVDFEQEERKAGKSKWNWNSLFRLALDGLLSYSIRPLRLVSLCGLMVSLCAFIYLLWVIIKYCIYGEPVHGYPTIVTLILFLGGVQLLSIGILGAYMGRAFRESKKRPNYFVRTYNNAKIFE